MGTQALPGSTGCLIHVDDPPAWLECQVYHQSVVLEAAAATDAVQLAYREIGERVVACLPPDQWTSKPVENGTSFARNDGSPPAIEVKMEAAEAGGAVVYNVDLSVVMPR